jgi:phosphatidylglycerol:prolipoprotein diacylglycerol transferase
MGKMDIAFPHLGIYLKNVPKSFNIGGYTIALYGCIFAAAMLAGIVMAAHMAKKTGQDPDTYWDAAIWIMIFSIVGARIYYVIFFWDAYKDDLLQIFNIRGGGIAIYGGIIGGVLTLYIYARRKKKKFFRMMDTLAYGLVLAQVIGRWANFTNREVFGRYTDSLFAMRLPVEMVRQRDITADITAHMAAGTNYIQVHPTFLYESLWNIGVLAVMLIFCRKKRYDGEISLIYFGGYGIGRAWIEAIRTDQLYLIGTKIPVSEVLGIVMFAASVVIAVISAGKVKEGKLEVTDYSRVAPYTGTEKIENKASEEAQDAAAHAPKTSADTIEKMAEAACGKAQAEGQEAEGGEQCGEAGGSGQAEETGSRPPVEVTVEEKAAAAAAAAAFFEKSGERARQDGQGGGDENTAAGAGSAGTEAVPDDDTE